MREVHDISIAPESAFWTRHRHFFIWGDEKNWRSRASALRLMAQ